MLLPVFNCLFYELHGFFYFLYHVDAKCVQIIFFFKMIYIFLTFCMLFKLEASFV